MAKEKKDKKDKKNGKAGKGAGANGAIDAAALLKRPKRHVEDIIGRVASIGMVFSALILGLCVAAIFAIVTLYRSASEQGTSMSMLAPLFGIEAASSAPASDAGGGSAEASDGGESGAESDAGGEAAASDTEDAGAEETSDAGDGAAAEGDAGEGATE